MLCMLTSLGVQAERDWSTPSPSAYPYHAVIYAKLVNADGQDVGSVGGNTLLGAFVGDECRDCCGEQQLSDDGTYLYTLRLGVNTEDAGKTVQFTLSCGSSEYTLQKTLTLKGGDETPYQPSAPLALPYTPLEAVSLSERINLKMGETANLLDYIKVQPDGANLPDEWLWQVEGTGTTASEQHVQVVGNIVTPLKPTLEGETVKANIKTGQQSIEASTLVIVHQPITGLQPNPDYPIDAIVVEVNDDKTLNDMLARVVQVTPTDATERIKWVSSDETGIQKGESDTGDYWLPIKAGEYTMTATAECGAKLDVKVKVIQRVTELKQTYQMIRVLKGEEVSQYLAFTYDILPADATVRAEGITYSPAQGYESQEGVVQYNNDGTITALKAGHAYVGVAHSDIPDKSITVMVYVEELPSADGFKVLSNPLSIEVASDDLGKRDVETLLRDNVSPMGGYESLFKSFTVEDAGATPILSRLADGSLVASKYGSTTVRFTYSTEACEIDGQGQFHYNVSKTCKFDYTLNVVQSLSALSFTNQYIAMGDADGRLSVETTPQGYILDETRLKFDIPVNAAQQPLFSLTRVAGKNEWVITPLQVGTGKLGLYYDQLSATNEVKVSQRLTLDEGWHWVSIYAGSYSKDYFLKDMYPAQEVRSQDELTYNDPVYGFFGSLEQMDARKCYKVNVKSGEHVNAYIYDNDLYTPTQEVELVLHEQWNWVGTPYCLDHDAQEITAQMTELPTGSRIISKDGGFLEYSGSAWEGDLKTLNAGEGYLVYQAGSDYVTTAFPAESQVKRAAPARRINGVRTASGVPSPWTYDSHRFADNMTIVAQGDRQLEADRYSVGAFVDGECRGEGVIVNGRIFITVHGTGQEQVTFRLHDNYTGETHDLEGTLPFAGMAGSISAPVLLRVPEATGLEGADADHVTISLQGDRIVVTSAPAQDVHIYNVSGQEVAAGHLAPGIYLVQVKTATGTLTKKVTKK